jgi:arylsulfatase A
LGWDWNAIKKPGAKSEGGDFAPEAFDWSKPVPGGPRSHGFDYYFGDDVPNFPPYAWFENDRIITEPTVMLSTTAKTAEGAWEARSGPSVKDWDFWAVMPKLTEKAVAWIGEQKKNEPFFLYFPFTSPHAPIVPAKEFVGKSKANGYGDFVVQTDDTVGRVLQALKDHGFADNTLVLFTSDNGPEHYAYARLKNYEHRSMGPLRGLKRDIWEGGHRVPLVVRWPGVVPAGKVSDGLISQIDIYATIAAIIGAEIPAGAAEDSYNQLALLQAAGPSARDTLVRNTYANGYAIRQGDWVLVAAKTGAVTKVPPWFDAANGYEKNSLPGELYNLRDDLAQKKNLYAEQPGKVKELTAQLEKLRAQGQVR